MIPITEYAGRDVAVFGLGRTGLSAAKALKAGGARVHAWDDNEETRRKAEASGLTLSDINKRDWQTFAALVLSPGIPYKFPQPHRIVRMAEMTGVPIVGDMELFARAVQSLPERGRPKIVGITGTNGKSTTTALIGHILNYCGVGASVGGNIGTPALSLELPPEDGAFVLEMSSFQLDLCPDFVPDVAVLLNMSPDHLDRHGTMAEYAEAKMRIFADLGKAVISIDDEWSRKIYQQVDDIGERDCYPLSVGLAVHNGVFVKWDKLYDGMFGHVDEVMELDVPTLPGVHNQQNAAAAYAACRLMSVEPAAIAEAIASFPGLPHRQHLIRIIGGVSYVNDSKATNADAASKALVCYEGIYWIVGGKPKTGGLDGLEKLMAHVKHAFVIGDAADDFSGWLTAQGVAHTVSGTLDKAVAQAHKMAQAASHTGTVLLSPACASFDQFKSFEERGDRFAALVEGLKEAAA